MKYIVIMAALILVSCSNTPEYQVVSKVPELSMSNNGLSFKEIENYQNYKVVATHFRTDKNELRYVMVNEAAFKAFSNNEQLPEGSKIVKIGWKVKEMSNFSVALEADKIQRVEYMIKDATRFKENPGNWGYARFVKESNKYKSWDKGTASCIGCHNLAKDNGFIFSKKQILF